MELSLDLKTLPQKRLCAFQFATADTKIGGPDDFPTGQRPIRLVRFASQRKHVVTGHLRYLAIASVWPHGDQRRG